MKPLLMSNHVMVCAEVKVTRPIVHCFVLKLGKTSKSHKLVGLVVV